MLQMRRYKAITIGAVAALAICGSATTIAAATDDYLTAQELFADFRYAAGLIPLRAAAEAGDVRARRALGLMLLHGDAVYGSEIAANRDEAVRWLRLAATQGCEASAHVLASLALRVASRGAGSRR